MKSLLVFIILTAAITSYSADDQKVKSGLFEVQNAQNQVNILFNEVNPQQQERVRYISQRLALAESYLQQSLNQYPNPPTPQPPPYQPPGSDVKVELFQSDSCQGDLIGIVNASTDCSKFSGAGNVWAIRVNGKCQDIDDTSAINACRLYQNAGNTQAVKVYKSDNCTDSLSGIFSTFSNCESLPNNGNNAWAIMVGNKCQDIADTSLTMSCRAFKAINSQRAVKLFHSDTCNESMVAAIDQNTNCETLLGLENVWAIQTNGQCQDVSDIDVVTACKRFKP
ncbi:hypothetical protein CIK05_00810 [Bdellovibrio sp. qaytius]|nr:hypothetical protein CIK05_00810 [Bdellovibrio sp. qaytius]